MIAIFARANHPRDGWSFAHGYVVIGVRCAHLGEVEAVKEKFDLEGFRLPDAYRVAHIEGDPDWSARGTEWFSGGRGAFDYLLTIDGDVVDAPWSRTVGSWGAIGDNRFHRIYDAMEVL